MKKKVVAAIGFCGLVLSQPASGMFFGGPGIMPTNSQNLLRFMPELQQALNIDKNPWTPNTMTEIQDIMDQVNGGLDRDTKDWALRKEAVLENPGSCLPWWSRVRTRILPGFMPVKLDVPAPYDIINGLCGAGVHVALGLANALRYDTHKVRLLLGMCFETFTCRNRPSFKRVRDNCLLNPIPEYVFNAYTRAVFGPSRYGFCRSHILQWRFGRQLESCPLWVLYELLRKTSPVEECLKYATLIYFCTSGERDRDLRCINLISPTEIPDDVLPSSVRALVAANRFPEIDPRQIKLLTHPSLVATDHIGLIPQMNQLAKKHNMSLSASWRAAALTVMVRVAARSKEKSHARLAKVKELNSWAELVEEAVRWMKEDRIVL